MNLESIIVLFFFTSVNKVPYDPFEDANGR